MTVAVYTLGCKVNLYESELIISLLKENNYTLVDFNEKADIYIINTCSVTNESDRKDRKIINEAKRKNKEAIIVVTGCYSQINPESIDADIVLGNKDKSKIIDLLDDYIKNKKQIKQIYDLTKVEFEKMNINKFENHTRAFVKVQDGCNAFCSYCIIPYARGRIRSKDLNETIEEVTNLVNNGYKEIVLTGIHTGRYGIDKNTNLYELLKKLVQIPKIFRIRLSSIEINEITDEIIELIKKNDIMAKHLHIPLQSGSDKILTLMNRKYDIDYFVKKIETIRKEIPDISITTDLIVGFPNETEEDFKDTIKLLNEIKFTKIHTFPYSKRKNTKAASMPNQIDGMTKKKRVHEVLDISNKYELEFYKSKLNKEYEVVKEERKNGECIGYTSNYIPVILEKNTVSDIAKIKITEVNSITKVYGKSSWIKNKLTMSQYKLNNKTINYIII